VSVRISGRPALVAATRPVPAPTVWLPGAAPPEVVVAPPALGVPPLIAVGERPEPSSVVPICAALPFVLVRVVLIIRVFVTVLLIKKPSPLRRGSWLLGSALRSVPSSILPPGAGNEYEDALNAKLERAENSEERYVDQAEVLGRHLHMRTIRPHEDGNVAAIPAIEQTQPGSP
jgi:hypothetical protein